VASPSDRTKKIAPAGDLARGSFWVSNPFLYPPNQNLSAYEPNQVFLNRGRGAFLTVTYLSGAGSDGDGRGALIADLTGDLQPDVLARHSGGGVLRLYANRMPAANRLTVRLKGTASNRRGIGACVRATIGARTLVREVFANNNFFCQAAPQAEFGLGDATKVDVLEIAWPSGKSQRIEDVAAGQVLTVTER
jgi:hypothetical protein